MGSRINLDLTNVASQSTSKFSVLENGSYLVVLADSEFKENKSGFGLTLGYMVEEGPNKGKMVRDYVTIRHTSSKQAEEIGQSRVKSIMVAQGRTNFNLFNDTDLVSNSKFIIEVTKEENSFTDEKTGKEVNGFKNNIKKILPLEKTASKTSETKKEEIKPSQTAATEKMPWEN